MPFTYEHICFTDVSSRPKTVWRYKKYPLRMQRIIIMYHKSEHNKRELIVKGLLLFYANILSIYKYTYFIYEDWCR